MDEVQESQDSRRRLVEEYWHQMGGDSETGDWVQKEERLRERVRLDRDDMQQENNELMSDL